jgi:hypothetical protein
MFAKETRMMFFCPNCSKQLDTHKVRQWSVLAKGVKVQMRYDFCSEPCRTSWLSRMNELIDPEIELILMGPDTEKEES